MLKCKEQNEYLNDSVEMMRNQLMETNNERGTEKANWLEENERVQQQHNERVRSLDKIIAEQREEANAGKQAREQLMEEYMKEKLEKEELRRAFDALRATQDEAVERIAEQTKSLSDGEENSRALSSQLQDRTEQVAALSEKLKEAQTVIESNTQQIAFERENFAAKLKAMEEEKESELKKQKENAEMFYQYEKERLLGEKNAEAEKASLTYATCGLIEK